MAPTEGPADRAPTVAIDTPLAPAPATSPPFVLDRLEGVAVEAPEPPQTGFVAPPGRTAGVASPLATTEVSATSRDLATIDRILRKRHVGRQDERRIIDILATASDHELDYLLAHIDLGRLVRGIDDRIVGPDNRGALLTLLCNERVAALGPGNRARLIDALQCGITRWRAEAAVTDLLLATRGRELTVVKNAVDEGGDGRDLHRLVYHDIDDASLRGAVVAHLRAEARRAPPAGLRVVSDIDDTFFASLKDRRWPKNTVYPGVRQLYRELGGEDAPVVFLTARVSALEQYTLSMLAARGVRAVVLTSDLVPELTHSAMGAKKHETFCEYAPLFEEYGFVLLGDSGQGDVVLCERALETHSGAVRAALVHDVLGTSAAERTRLREKGIVVFDTYVGAAHAAHLAGLLTREAMLRVGAEAMQDLESVRFDSDEQRRARREELERDLAAASAAGRTGTA